MKLLISLFTLSTLLTADINLPQNFKTDFHQIITNEKGKVITYDGSVVFKNQTRSLFKWNYTSPTQKEVCTDGTSLIVVDHDLEQISSYMINDGINLEEIVKIAKKISDLAYEAMYKEVKYLIGLDENKQLKQIVYIDALDNAVKIIFNNMTYNTTVEESTLDCNAPQDYDVIKG